MFHMMLLRNPESGVFILHIITQNALHAPISVGLLKIERIIINVWLHHHHHDLTISNNELRFFF